MCGGGGGGQHTFYERQPGAAKAPPPAGFAYRPREPTRSVLFQLVNDELATFRARVGERAEGAGLPAFVWRDLERFMACGDIRSGFMRVRCRVCRRDILVGFSCHSRGLCPSCGARRMHDTAFHLVDRVLPQVAYRHWVLSFPRRLRPLLARSPEVVNKALDLFLAAVFRFQRRQARALGLREVGCGAVCFLSRAGDSLNLHPHFHALVPDGIFTRIEGELRDTAQFHPLPTPTDEDILVVAQRIVLRTRKTLEKLGLLWDPNTPDAMDCLFQDSLGRPGPRTDSRRPHHSRLEAFVEGFSLQAATRVHQNDRQGLERLCLYGARPPIAASRLEKLPDGTYSYQLKYPLPDGSTVLVLSGQQMIGRIALLIPRPGRHLVRYKGVFAGHSSWRHLIVPQSPRKLSCAHGHAAQEPSHPGAPSTPPVLPTTCAHPLLLPPLSALLPAVLD